MPYRGGMRRECMRVLHAILYAIAAIAILDPAMVKAGSAVQTRETNAANLQMVMDLVREALELQKQLQARLVELQEKYPDDRVVSIEPSDLLSAQGISAARERAQRNSSMTKDLASVARRFDEEWETRALRARLPEPYKSQVNAMISKSRLKKSKWAAEWQEADRRNALAVVDMLAFAERNGGKIGAEKGKLVFASNVLKAEYDGLLQTLETTERRANESERQVLFADDGTRDLLKRAILEYRGLLDTAR